MKKFLFNTTATMKEHDRKNWYIDGDIIPTFYTFAESSKEALVNYVKFADEKHYITISANAIKSKAPMYIDLKDGSSKQIGYVLTGKYSFDDGRSGWTDKYIDLWVDVCTVEYAEFENN